MNVKLQRLEGCVFFTIAPCRLCYNNVNRIIFQGTSSYDCVFDICYHGLLMTNNTMIVMQITLKCKRDETSLLTRESDGGSASSSRAWSGSSRTGRADMASRSRHRCTMKNARAVHQSRSRSTTPTVVQVLPHPQSSLPPPTRKRTLIN